MIFKPEKQLVFSYAAGKHLSTSLILKNTSSTPLAFKFKVSNTHKFFIKPYQGSIKGGDQLEVQVVIHRDIVQNASNQKVIVSYGSNFEQNKGFDLVVENGSKTDKLNLTMMISEKEERIKHLEDEVRNYQMMPMRTADPPKKKKSLKTILIILVLGLLIGYFAPIRLFKKGW